MIIVKLLGGLGNQMFQYAAGKALALRHGVEVKVELSALNSKAGDQYTPRHYELGIFASGIQVANDKDVAPFANRYKSKVQRELQNRLPFLFKTLNVVERGIDYHPKFTTYPENTYLQGFWQSERYFKEYETEIRRDFRFRESVTEACKPLREKIAICNAVSLHIRRGDYISNSSANAFHGTCSPQYYADAVNYIVGKQKEIEIFVFSDDINWCKENLKLIVPVHFIETGSAYEDMYLMSQCRHHIIANSSFSWWGAWLNANPDKIVVAPKQWLAATDVKDMIPQTWIKL